MLDIILRHRSIGVSLRCSDACNVTQRRSLRIFRRRTCHKNGQVRSNQEAYCSNPKPASNSPGTCPQRALSTSRHMARRDKGLWSLAFETDYVVGKCCNKGNQCRSNTYFFLIASASISIINRNLSRCRSTHHSLTMSAEGVEIVIHEVVSLFWY